MAVPNGVDEWMGASLPESQASSLPGGPQGRKITDAADNEYTGWLVEPFNPGELAHPVIKLLSNGMLRQKLGTLGEKKHAEFDLDKQAQNLTHVY
jgi:glycosyltransferase involved in cell wall biosynthesis